MDETRLNVRVEGVMAQHVNHVIAQRLYNNQSEYIRDLIRHDMENAAVNEMAQMMRESHSDIMAGRIIKSSGNFEDDYKALQDKENNGWD